MFVVHVSVILNLQKRYVHPSEADTKGRHSVVVDRLVALVVKASASRAEDPGFESRLRRDFFGVESYQ